MNAQMMKRAVRLFPRTAYLDAATVRHARRQWLISVTALGDKWILAKPVVRSELSRI